MNRLNVTTEVKKWIDIQDLVSLVAEELGIDDRRAKVIVFNTFPHNEDDQWIDHDYGLRGNMRHLGRGPQLEVYDVIEKYHPEFLDGSMDVYVRTDI